MLDTTPEPQNRKLNTQFTKKAMLCPRNFSGVLECRLPLAWVWAVHWERSHYGLCCEAAKLYTIVTCHLPSLLFLYFFESGEGFGLGVMRQPHERYICKSFAAEMKRTPAVGPQSQGRGVWWNRISAMEVTAFFGNLKLRFCWWDWLLSCLPPPPPSFFMMTV